MAVYDSRLDAYIEKSAPFAQPILRHLRELMHRASPEIVEAIKWGMPFFTLDGKNFAHMAAFKGHAAFGFWPKPEVELPKEGEAMGHFGKIRTLDDLPDEQQLVALITAAAERLRAGEAGMVAKKPKPPKPAVTATDLPDDFAAAIKANDQAQQTYDRFAPGYRREYIEWITSAKRPETRQQRIVQAVSLLAEGKHRNWKYR